MAFLDKQKIKRRRIDEEILSGYFLVNPLIHVYFFALLFFFMFIINDSFRKCKTFSAFY